MLETARDLGFNNYIEMNYAQCLIVVEAYEKVIWLIDYAYKWEEGNRSGWMNPGCSLSFLLDYS